MRTRTLPTGALKEREIASVTLGSTVPSAHPTGPPECDLYYRQRTSSAPAPTTSKLPSGILKYSAKNRRSAFPGPSGPEGEGHFYTRPILCCPAVPRNGGLPPLDQENSVNENEATIANLDYPHTALLV